MRCHLHDGELVPCPICSNGDLYMPETYGNQDCPKDIEGEHRRMLLALEAIHRISGDMLDPVRRAGPGVNIENQRLREMQTNEKDR